MSYGLDSVQNWLERVSHLDLFSARFLSIILTNNRLHQVTSYEMPSAVDSAAIAGVVDVLHTQGCEWIYKYL